MNLLQRFPLLAQFIPGRWTVYLMLAGIVGGFGGGLWVAHKFHQATAVIAVNTVLNKERGAAAIGNKAESTYLDQLRKNKETTDAKLENLRRRLATAPACRMPVPAEWLRKPANLPGIATFAGSAGSTAPGLDTFAGGNDSADSRAVVETCERNRLEIMEPNAAQLRALQGWYEVLRKREVP